MGKKQCEGADEGFSRGRGGDKGHRACRRVGGDRRKCAYMMTDKEQREWHLVSSLGSMEPKSGKKGSFQETNQKTHRERG